MYHHSICPLFQQFYIRGFSAVLHLTLAKRLKSNREILVVVKEDISKFAKIYIWH